MTKKLRILAILLPIMILGIFSGHIIPQGHAATGTVCIAAVTDISTACPASPPSFNGPLTTPNSLLRVPVMIAGTDTVNGFDITVNSTRDTGGHSVLKPYGVDLTGSVAPANSIPLLECVGANSIVGSSCNVNATIDNPSTIRAAVIFSAFVPIGTTGLLFTAIFSINGTSLAGGVAVGFQNHCDPYPSKSSNGHLCISMSNGSIGAAPENVATGSFDNSATATLPYVTLSTPSANLGQSLAGSTAHAIPTVSYTATSQNGFQTSTSPQLALAVSFNGSNPRPTVALNMSSLDLTNLAAHPFTQTGNVAANVPTGVYIATVTATYTTADMITFTTDSLSAVYTLSFNVTDYVLSTSLSTVPITPPGSQPVSATITPKVGFNTLVKLGITLPAATTSAGIGATFNSYTISGGSGSSTLTITTSANTPGGSFSLTITSNSTLNGLTIAHTKIITVNTLGFTISASTPPPQSLGTSATSTITVTYFNSFPGIVALTNNTVTNLSCLAITPASLSSTGTATIQCDSLVKGTYTLTITGMSGSNVLSTTVTFNFTLQVHDVKIAATAIITPGSSTTVGTSVNVNVQIQNKGAQSENVTVILLGDNLTITRQSVVIPANSNKNVTLTWDTTMYTARSYNLSVTVQLQSGETNVESGQQTLNGAIGTYTLNSTNPGPSYDLTTIAIIAGIIVAIAVIATIVLVRRRSKTSVGTQPGTL